jgi:type III secretory pathway component EscV
VVARAKRAGGLGKLGGADAALALLVIAVVGLMIVPLPTWLLDILLATNISVSVAVLLVVLYVPDALGAREASS